ncbi:MAG: DUF2892 domain-containing protein [Turicibacter sanguinis]|uniref:YgaP family membrane protein n=1 Tax=Turicibacter sanguinis TaxID=154288 RepID=UPI00399575F1
MCQKNVGRLDSYVRISAGLMMISLGIMKHKGWLAAMGSMKVAEGITRYCPILDLCHFTTLSDDELLEEVLLEEALECAIDDACGCGCDDDFDDYGELEDEHDCHCCHHDIEDYAEEGM